VKDGRSSLGAFGNANPTAAGSTLSDPVANPGRVAGRGTGPAPRSRRKAPVSIPGFRGDPQWYRDAVIYEVNVRAFRDSDGDGTGDFRGLIDKLDYLADLGVTALWLLPFYPSPMRDDGYDIADYVNVNPAYGTLRDAETFIREAHKRGLRVITELVCNHTSDQHPWFQRARRARPGSSWRDYYVWSDSPDRYADARVIFGDFEASNWTWDQLAGAYYWHRFYSHQPDLNYDSPRVRAAIVRVVDFWLDRGVDGLRLDAVPYLYQREGTDCENLPETHQFLRELRRHVDERYPDRMLLAEANQWPEQSAAYFGDGDECHMAFNFPVMPRMFMALRMEDRLPIVDIVEQTPPVPEGAQWALFLRNHDELTLEMVTDEERDYMYRVYADDPLARVNLGIRRRLAPLLGNHRRRIELMNGLLFSLPGTPVIYYGDEIGMGDNVHLGDRGSVRTPMQWSGDRNAGFSSADAERLYLPVVADPEHHFEAVNVAVQQANPHSLLWWMKRLIALRKRHPALARGELVMLHPENRHVLAFIRRLDGVETILVVANLSRFFQPVALDLSDMEGRQPIEVFGRIEFPPVGRRPYPLSLGPHEFLWLSLEPPATDATPPVSLGTLTAGGIGDFVDGRLDDALASVLGRWVRDRPWYRGRGRRVKDAEIVDRIEVPLGPASALVVALRVSYTEGEADVYLIPLTTAVQTLESLVFADGVPCRAEPPGLRIATLASADGLPSGRLLVDASPDLGFTSHLTEAIASKRRLRGSAGELVGRPDPGLRRSTGDLAVAAGDTIRIGETVGLGQGPATRGGPRDLTLELRHAFEAGEDAEAEVMRFLGERGADWAPRVFGTLEYRPGKGAGPAGVSGVAALLREALVHDGDVAEMTGHALLGFFELAATMPAPARPSITAADLLEAASRQLPEQAHEMVGSYLETARSIGNRIGEFHVAMAAAPDDPSFAPEPFTRLYQTALFQPIDALAIRVLRLVEARASGLDRHALAEARSLDDLRAVLRSRLALLLSRKLSGSRIRIHGALRLAEVMHAERGLVMIDFEGDTSRPAGERRLKRSPLRDLAAMLRSFYGLAMGRLREAHGGGSLRSEDMAALDVWARQWYLWVAAAFLRGYGETAGEGPFLPARDEWACLLDAFLIQGALEDLYEALRHEPENLAGPLRGLLELLGR
jgi:maltose alpha-D-glucosyltransferase/alpha-amylase